MDWFLYDNGLRHERINLFGKFQWNQEFIETFCDIWVLIS